tara:strand:+ start:624 stop:1583 length:960 start_codon:yes stop_codon:yes gene_type:complete
LNKYPFIQYYLYKNNNNEHHDLITFPFIKINTSNNILKKSKDLYKELTNNDNKPDGFIQRGKNVYVFFNGNNIDNGCINTTLIQRNDNWWWTLIDEICNSKTVVNFKIHESVYSIFYNYPELIYLIDKKTNTTYEIPTAAYYGTSQNLLNYVSTLGIKANIEREFGPFYYFNNFIGSTRRAGWSSNYKNIYMDNKTLTKNNGEYKEGGYVRFAIFLGNSKVIQYRKNSKFYNFIAYFENNDKKDYYKKHIQDLKNKWTKSYDSIVISNIKYKNTDNYYNINKQIILKDYDNFISLSYHMLDTSTLKHLWDPFYEKYNIL